MGKIYGINFNEYMISMSAPAEIIANNLAFVYFFILAITLCCLILIGGWILGGKASARHKHTPFESGIDSTSTARLRVPAKFSLIAMFFVIFEVETIYLFAWSTCIRESGWMGFIEAFIFILVLLVSLAYLVRVDSLNWTPMSLRHQCADQKKNTILS